MRNTDPAFVRDLDSDKVEALIEMMYLAAMADEEFSSDERRQFMTSVEDLTSRAVTGERLSSLLERVQQEVEKSGREARLSAVKGRLPDPNNRRFALALAIQVMAADKRIRTSEYDLIMEAADALDIDRETAADMVKEIRGA
jgi:uncharacterized tellurite resistance protein B-like protein